MKLTLHTLTTDLENEGTTTSVHPSREALHPILRAIIEKRLTDTAPWTYKNEDEEATELRRLLDANDIEAAWDLYQNGLGDEPAIKNSQDYYWIEQHEIELPGSAPNPASASDCVLIPRDRLKALFAELRTIRAEINDQSRRIARPVGELVEWVNFPAAPSAPISAD